MAYLLINPNKQYRLYLYRTKHYNTDIIIITLTYNNMFIQPLLLPILYNYNSHSGHSLCYTNWSETVIATRTFA
jgi:hypothetical protein